MVSLSRRAMLAAGSLALLAGCLGTNTEEWTTDEDLPVDSVTQYQGPSCDCCDEYHGYLADHVPGSVESEVVDDIGEFQANRDVAPNLRSCHVLDIEGYQVIGHVPVEVIDELLTRDPAYAGISLPGMPAGSPGMGGSKDGTWEVYGYTEDGEVEVFTEL